MSFSRQRRDLDESVDRFVSSHREFVGQPCPKDWLTNLLSESQDEVQDKSVDYPFNPLTALPPPIKNPEGGVRPP